MTAEERKIKNDCCHNFNYNNITQCCFAIGCPSLDYLLTEKHWQQTMFNEGDQIAMTHDTNKDQIVEDFNKYYTLESFTEREKTGLTVVKIDFFKIFN